MRKVTQEIALAFKAGKSAFNDNTSTSGESVLLFGNPIARKVNGRLEISMCGYPTSTTCERLNGILDAFGSKFRVGRKNRAPVAWAGGVVTPFPANGWQAVSDVKL